MSPVYFVNKVPSTLIVIPGPRVRGTGGTRALFFQQDAINNCFNGVILAAIEQHGL